MFGPRHDFKLPQCPITQMVECRTVNSDVPGSRPGGAA